MGLVAARLLFYVVDLASCPRSAPPAALLEELPTKITGQLASGALRLFFIGGASRASLAHQASSPCTYRRSASSSPATRSFSGVQTWLMTSNVDQWIEALERIRQLDVDYVVPGYGPVTTLDYLHKQRAVLMAWKAAVADAVATGWVARGDDRARQVRRCLRPR